MQIIQHRINTTAQYENVPHAYGIELDIRYDQNNLILHHDPFGHHEHPLPEKFVDLLSVWKNDGTMILNVKTEGIEKRCIALMQAHKIKDWFFLDLSMPYFAMYAEEAFARSIAGFSPDNLAVRFSEREPLAYALSFAAKARWIWVDCFTQMPLTQKNFKAIKEAGFKICLVAPELQHHPLERTQEFQAILQKEKVQLDAVCTKYPEQWINYEN
ncbi:MAG TPA: hypothetical protein VNC84_04360 [Gammaproteobacteria bacterium]|jgi:hypothetical protein|nr:hypothetical protein [Gammaproteobacteria bacterium]